MKKTIFLLLVLLIIPLVFSEQDTSQSECETASNIWFDTAEYKSAQGVVDWGTASNPDLSAWVDTSGVNCNVSIADEIDGHKNVMKLDDQSSSTRWQIKKVFDHETSGTVEV